MLRSLTRLKGYKVEAADGRLGTVDGLYFDDHLWTVRYIVVDTGRWLSGRKVLISPAVVKEPDRETQSLEVSLTREQVETSPGIDPDVSGPVSRQEESLLADHYGWVPYWSSLVSVMMSPQSARPPVPALPMDRDEAALRGDPRLRSVDEVTGYHIQAADGEVGYVADFIGQTGAWIIRYLVVDTRNWLLPLGPRVPSGRGASRKVLVSPVWIDRVDWVERKVTLALTDEEIRESPEFDASVPVNREYEELLYDYYGRPKYWRS